MDRFKKAQMREEAFKKELEDKHLTAPIDDKSKQDIFHLAWEYGHSSGDSEVEYYYIDLAILVNDIARRNIG